MYLPSILEKTVPQPYVDPKKGVRKVVEVPLERGITKKVVAALYSCTDVFNRRLPPGARAPTARVPRAS